MSRTLFRLDIPDEVRAENLDGRELTRRGFAVSKFAAQSTTPTILVDNSEDFVIAYNAVAPATTRVERNAGNRVITFTNGTTGLINGGTEPEYVFIGWKIIVGSDTEEGSLYLPSGSTSANYYFINCDIVYRNLAQPTELVGGATQTGFAVGYSTELNGDRAGSQYGDTAIESRSLNSYGCSHSYEDGTNRFIRWSDLIDSEIVFLRGFGRVDSSGNGRQIRSSLTRLEGNAPYIIRPYGRMDIENSIYSNFGFTHGNTGTNQPTQFVADRPRFMPTGAGIAALEDIPAGQLTFFSFNIGQTQDQPIQLIGGPSMGNDANVVFGAITNQGTTAGGFGGGILRSDRVNRGYSGLNHYYGVGDRYFSDGAQTVGAAGVRVRLSGTINPDTVSSTAGTLGGRAFSQTGADFINGNVSIIGQTNTEGRLATHQYVLGANAPVNGTVNWWLWQPEPLQGLEIWAGNTDVTQSPPGMMLMPISRAYIVDGTTNEAATADNAFRLDNITVTQERRSFAWDINQVPETIGYPDARVNLEIPQNSIVTNSLSGTRVKAGYIDAPNNIPDLTRLHAAFPATATTASLNDIDNAFRALWFDFETDHTPDEDTTTLANNYNLSLNSNLGDPFSVALDAGVTTITVRSNGIDAKNDDLYRARRFNVVDLFNNPVRNQDITATTINRARQGSTIDDSCFSNCTVSGTLNVSGDATGFSDSYFFNLADVSGVDLVQLETTGGTGNTIIRGRIFDQTLNGGAGAIRALAATDFNSVTPHTGSGGTITFENPPFVLTLRPDATLEDLRARGGFWRVTDTSGNIITAAGGNVNITNTTTIEDVTVNFTSASQTLRAYYQPGATPGGYVANYGFMEVVSSSITEDTNFVVTPVDYTALASDTSVDRSGDVTITTLGSNSTQTINMLVDISSNVTAVQSQEIAIVLLNDVSYIDTVIARDFTGHQRILEFLQPFLVRYNGGLDSSGNPVRPVINLFVTGTTPRGIANTSGYLSNPTAGNSAFFDTSVVQVVAPVADISTAIDNSTRLQEIDNKTSWMVTDGATSNAQLTGGRLSGIKPKQADYAPGNDYTTNT